MMILAAPLLSLHGATEPPPASTGEQKTALDVLDGIIDRFDKLLAKDDDPAHHTATKARLDEFKARRDDLHSAYDQAKYDELRVDLNLEYQRLASWMAPPKTPPPNDKAGRK